MGEEIQAPAAVVPPADPLIGRVLNDRFTLLERIGAGGMGQVYRALQSPLDRVVAVKLLDSNYAAGRDIQFQKRFFLEASLTSRLRHPNTITVLDYGRTPDGLFFIAMEYVEGLTLSQVLAKEGWLPWMRVMQIAQQICRSLREAHRLGIIHRDLKPANVMLVDEEAENDLIKVLDFGLVKSIAALAEGPSPEDSGITESGTLLGSPLYMAPEHARHLPADARSDLYSLGIVMYQMLTGKPPFQGQSIDVIVKHVHEQPAPFRVARPDLDVPADVEALVLKCLAKDPADRYQSMDELLDAIRTVAGSDSISAPRPRPAGVPHEQYLEESGRTFTVSGPEGQDEALPPVRSGWRKLAIAGSLVISAAAVFVFLKLEPTRASPAEPRVAQDPPAQATPAPKERREVRPDTPAAPLPTVRFQIASRPQGAAVWLGGRKVGDTPFALDVPADEDGTARALLTFKLDGYLPQTLSASGAGEEVTVSPTLKARSTASAEQRSGGRDSQKPHPEYKADPYE